MIYRFLIPHSHKPNVDGPFYISCHSEQLFFKVSDDNKVVVTDDVNDASEFFIVPCEEDAKSRHFSIFYNSESKLKQPKETRPRMRIKPIPRYLCTSVNFRGISNNPLDLKLNAKESKSMLVLQDRRSKHLHPVDLTDWINGKEIYYINCKHRSFKKDSYICVTADRHSGSTTQMDDVDGEGEVSNGASQNETSRAAAVADSGRSGDRHRYSTCCKSSVSAHDDHSNFMLFRLIRVKQKDDDWERYEDHEAIDSDAQGDRRASVDGHKGGRGGGGGGRRNKMAKSQSITEANPDE